MLFALKFKAIWTYCNNHLFQVLINIILNLSTLGTFLEFYLMLQKSLSFNFGCAFISSNTINRRVKIKRQRETNNPGRMKQGAQGRNVVQVTGRRDNLGSCDIDINY